MVPELTENALPDPPAAPPPSPPQGLLRRLWRGRGWRWSLLRVGLLLLLGVVTPLVAGVTWMTRMPGSSHPGALPPLSETERAIRDALARHVRALAGGIGPRNLSTPDSLERSLLYLESELRAMGFEPRRESYQARGETVSNLIAETFSSGPLAAETGLIVIGAHYDSVASSPGADDNASGCAALLELARAFSPESEPASSPRALRFVFFVNEEKPFAMTPEMGSFVHARGCRQRGEKIEAMLSLESLGYFTDEPGSQLYPSPVFGVIYPTTGNFIALVGDTASRPLVRHAMALFRETATLPSEGAALPRGVAGVGWSDHWSFWMQGYQALMVTGTAPFRNPHYHMGSDTPDTLDYDRMARVVAGLRHTVRRMRDARE